MLSSSRPTLTHTYPCHTPRALALGNIWPRFLFTLFIACAAIERDIIMIILPRAPVFLHCSSSERSIHLHPWPRAARAARVRLRRRRRRAPQGRNPGIPRELMWFRPGPAARRPVCCVYARCSLCVWRRRRLLPSLNAH